jgi:DNA primase
MSSHPTQGSSLRRPNPPLKEVTEVSSGGWDLDEIRRRADIVEVVSPYVSLRKAGRRLVGLCPFHKERTPSFTLDPETGLWHCFGCKAGGDLFRFVEMIEKVPFAEAVELLARRLGLPPRRPADAARQHARDRLLSIHEQAASFFRAQLGSQRGSHARAYLSRRGLSEQCIHEFGIGYAPDAWDALLAALRKRGFSSQELQRAGLILSKDGSAYDRFRNRVIFPICDITGRTIAFGGRALADEQQPKYLNSPETPLFHKGRTLWVFDRARRAMADAGQAIIVEGYLDAIACHEAGLVQTVATMGTALTAEHVEMLRRRVGRLLLAFDSDSAGLAAALRGRELFEQAGLDVRVVTLPENMDPDDLIRSKGPDAFRALISEALPIIEWELNRILAQADGKGERERMEALREAAALLARVAAGVEREYYVRWLARKWGSDRPDRAAAMEKAVREELLRRGARRRGGVRRMDEGRPSREAAQGRTPARPAAGRVHVALLAAFLQRGDLAARYARQLEPADFPTEEQRAVFEAVRRLVDREEPVGAQTVLAEVAPEARGALAEFALDEVPEERMEESIASAVQRVIETRLERRQRALLQKFNEAASEQQREAVQQELTEVVRQRSELAGRRIVGDG